MTDRPYLTDDEVREVCEGISRPSAMIRYLRDVVRVPIVVRKPNGMPLVGRDALRAALGARPAQADQPRQEPNLARLRAISSGRRV